MSEWDESTLSNVVSLRRGHDLPSSQRRPGNVPVLGSFGVTGWHDKVKAPGPGVTIGRSGASIGTAAYVDRDYWPLNTCLYVTDFNGNHPRWVFHLLDQIDFAGYNSGSAQPSLNRNFLAQIPVPVPPLDEQRRIASVLGAFDDLIETNRVQAQRAAHLARATGEAFMSTLTDRDSAPLTDFCQAVKGFSYKSTELIEGADTLVNLKNIGRRGTFKRQGFKPLTSDRFKPGHVVEPGDVVVSMTDLTQDRNVIAQPVRVPDAEVNGQMVASLDLAVLRPHDGFTSEFLFAALARDEFRDFAFGFCNGTTVLHLGSEVFSKYRLPAVTPEETVVLVKNLSALNAQEDACLAEVEDLTRTRDELVPHLMSGRVRVKDLEVTKGVA